MNKSAAERCEEDLVRARLSRAEATCPKGWSPEFDLALVRTLWNGGWLTAVAEASGYSINTCITRLSKLLPETMTHSARAALIGELEARAAQEDQQQSGRSA